MYSVHKGPKQSYSLSRAKIVPVTLALRSTKYLFQEREYIPWQSALNNLDYFYLMFTQTDVYGLLQVCPQFIFLKYMIFCCIS